MKSIVVFSDGTGNSSAKFFKTNVYRLYQAIDTTPENQVVAYDSGVGTSTFKPLALLGGAFGVGLMRNVLDLYKFVCRHYEPGDRIYAFGFSRGAFTIRLLVGLIAQIGVVRAEDKAVLDVLAEDAYRAFRRCFRLSGNRDVVTEAEARKRKDLTDLLVTPLRNLRDRTIRRGRKRRGLPVLADVQTIPVESIQFVGVWDTVAAYGSPIAEITKGIDRWIWPLSMPDYKLSEKVQFARHALALDDERDTFHPLLWDEVHERDLVKQAKVSDRRLQQVWFAGMHSDVGGGYSDDALAYVSLVWMAREAHDAGLRLKKNALESFELAANPFGPMHNSRSGAGAYYRYQPRKIAARLERPDPSTLLQQDPDMKGRGLLTRVRIHESVIARIRQRTDHYAPLVLPNEYEVVGGDPNTPQPLESHRVQRAAAQERVYDDVWRRRVNYFFTLFVTIWTVLFPFVLPPRADACVGPQCLASPVIRYIGGWLPDFTDRLFAGYAARPGVFLICIIAIYLLMRRAGRLETGLRDRMHRLLMASFSGASDASAQIAGEDAKPGLVRRFRSSSGYQTTLRAVKWKVGPAGAAALLLSTGALLFAALVGTSIGGAHRISMAWDEQSLAYCADAAPAPAAGTAVTFETRNMCSRTPFEVVAGKRYRLKLALDEAWHDKSIHASPAGFASERMPWYLRSWAGLFRRSFNDPWFQPIVTIENGGRRSGGMLSVPMTLVSEERGEYSGYFTAPSNGRVSLSVNDAVLLWGSTDTKAFYQGADGLNSGKATVQLLECTGKTLVPCD